MLYIGVSQSSWNHRPLYKVSLILYLGSQKLTQCADPRDTICGNICWNIYK